MCLPGNGAHTTQHAGTKMNYLCTHGNGSSFTVNFDDKDAIEVLEYAIGVFDSLSDYVLPIRAIDCNGCGASTGWDEEKERFCGDVIERFRCVDGTLGGASAEVML